MSASPTVSMSSMSRLDLALAGTKVRLKRTRGQESCDFNYRCKDLTSATVAVSEGAFLLQVQ